jgi:DNA-binding CsgD family transcriptional regulator
MTYIPTDREMEMLRAYLDAGTCKEAGVLLGVSEQAVKQTLWRMRLKARVNGTPQLLFLFHSELRTMGVTR